MSLQSSPHLLASRAYAVGLAGPDAVMPAWGGALVRRPLADGQADGAGIYPLTVFGPGADLAAGLAELKTTDLVSVVLVPDPLLSDLADLKATFEVCRPFKTHHLIDPGKGAFAPNKHHRYEIRRAHSRCTVDVVGLADHLAEWSALYAGLVAREGITGAANFSPGYFAMLAGQSQIVALRATVSGAPAGMALWFEGAGVVYNHLNAANALGYAHGANYALYDSAIALFTGRGVINLGGGAGVDGDSGGLAVFKAGFANAAVEAHLCGAVLDPARYRLLSKGRPATGFFPAYRG